MLYIGSDAVLGFSGQAHVSRLDFWALFLGPALLWVVFPLLIARRALHVLATPLAAGKSKRA